MSGLIGLKSSIVLSGLPDYSAWYLRLKGEYVLNLSDFQECKKTFKEKGMQTFADWLRYYDDFDVALGLEAFGKDESLLHSQGHGHLERRGQAPKSELALSLKKHDRMSSGALQPLQRDRTGSNNQWFVSESLATTSTMSREILFAGRKGSYTIEILQTQGLAYRTPESRNLVWVRSSGNRNS